jgi:tetratricopeptide (TPR) repeat protein
MPTFSSTGWLRVCGLAAALGVWALPALANDESELRDLAARVQFNAYAADVRALRADIAALTQLQLSDDLLATRQYFTGYAQWKLAETLLENDRSGAKRAAEQCQAALQPIISAQPPRSNEMPRAQRERWFQRRAEALAISAGCKWSAAESSFLPGSNMLGSMKVDSALEEAAVIAPNNPRVKFVDAMLSLRRASSKSERIDAERKLTAITAIFDALPPSDPGAPDWGYAEALAYLGQSYLEVGNRIGARNALERALVLAPDYRWARELLKQTALTPR